MKESIDKEAFLELIQNNKGIIYKVCNSYCQHKNNIEDLAQEIIYHLWKSFPAYNRQFKFTTWMYRVGLNVAISYYRKEKKNAPTGNLNEDLFEIEDGLDYSMETDANIELLQQFINALKELDRALMILYLDNRPYKEIGEILGISETNVATKVARIKNELRQKFNTIKQ